MKHMKRNNYKVLIIIIFMMLGENIVIAQNGPPNPPDGENTQNNKLGAPISGAVMLVLGLGAAYGSSVLKRKEEE